MDINSLIHGFGSVGMFSSRAFLPALVTAVTLRYGSAIPYIESLNLLKNATQEPTWFTHGGTITALGLLSILEIAADKMPEARTALAEIDGYSKTALAGLSYLGLLSAVDIQFIKENISQAGVTDTFAVLIVAGAVLTGSKLRVNLLNALREADEDDDLGIQSLISWAEDIWATVGIFALLLFPIFMLLLNGVALTILFLAQKFAQYREEKSKVECGDCRESVYRSALACPHCGAKREKPDKLGILGQSKHEAEDDLEAPPYYLVAKKRCPVCATRFPKRSVHQTCEACGHQLMGEKEFARSYLSRIRKRVPVVCGVSFLLSLIPVIGLVPGVIYYRLRLVAPFRQYVPLGRRLFIKLLIMLLFFVLIGLQWIPGIGGFVVPAMALISYGVFSAQFRSLTGI